MKSVISIGNSADAHMWEVLTYMHTFSDSLILWKKKHCRKFEYSNINYNLKELVQYFHSLFWYQCFSICHHKYSHIWAILTYVNIVCLTIVHFIKFRKQFGLTYVHSSHIYAYRKCFLNNMKKKNIIEKSSIIILFIIWRN